MMHRVTVTGKPIVSPLSDPINSMVTPDPIPGVTPSIEMEGTDVGALTHLPHPGALFWCQFDALRFGELCQKVAEDGAIALREQKAKQDRATRAKVEWYEDLDTLPQPV